MARRRGTAILERQREIKKSEKQAMKKEKRDSRWDDESPAAATAEDLEAYGLVASDSAENREPGD